MTQTLIDKRKSYNRSYYLKNKDIRWQKVNPSEYRASQNKHHHSKRSIIFNLLGNKCKICGFSDIRALQIDHVNGGGNKDRISGTQYLNKILKKIDSGEYQLLCANCNWIKKHENDEVRRIYCKSIACGVN